MARFAGPIAQAILRATLTPPGTQNRYDRPDGVLKPIPCANAILLPRLTLKLSAAAAKAVCRQPPHCRNRNGNTLCRFR
ncbi:hypothetical protein KCP73_17765 [Salmonella enterica subsp. enterica]|nr:hypothetical protein KCP73_17765 [Salmonella enterica subsp. enterica]